MRVGSGTEVVSVLAQRAASEGPRWMRAIETTSMPDLSGEECKEKCARTMRAVEYPPIRSARASMRKGGVQWWLFDSLSGYAST